MNPDIKTYNYKSLGFPSLRMFTFPNIINIEVFSGKCPCNCLHCPVGKTPYKDRPAKFGLKEMDLKTYKRIIKEVANYKHSTVRLHSKGEPLLWSNIANALKYTWNANVKSWLFTCGVTKDLRLIEKICKYTSIIEISINSINSDDYKKTKGIDAFDTVFMNIQYMRSYIDKYRLPTRLIVSRVQSENKKRDDEFIDFWKSTKLVNDAFVRTYHTYNNLISPLKQGEDRKQKLPCLVHWARFNINIIGDVLVCFNETFKNDILPELILGNIHKNSIREIWQSGKLNAIRKAELNSDYSGLFYKDSLPCLNCYSCQPLNTNNISSENQIKKLKI